MKTIEQKAEAYDKVREKIALRFGSNVVKEIFAEFEESEDERMRKFVKYAVDYLFNSKKEKYICNTHIDEVVAWIEKQGQKSATIDIDKMVDDYINDKERGNEEFGKPVPCMIRAYRQGLNDAMGKVVMKTAWSEEDRIRIANCIRLIGKTGDGEVEWLKSLESRILPQTKQEWSEEDEKNLEETIWYVEKGGKLIFAKTDKLVSWLKSLKDRVQLQNTVTDEELSQAKKDAYNDALDKIEYHSGEPTFDDGWDAAIWYLKKKKLL